VGNLRLVYEFNGLFVYFALLNGLFVYFALLNGLLVYFALLNGLLVYFALLNGLLVYAFISQARLTKPTTKKEQQTTDLRQVDFIFNCVNNESYSVFYV
jgi:hypothetical protein